MNLKKITIISEQREIFTVRVNRQNGVAGFCAECAAESEFFTLDEAVSFSGESTRRIIRRVDAGAIHVLEAMSGHLLVCRNSLEAVLKLRNGARICADAGGFARIL